MKRIALTVLCVGFGVFAFSSNGFLTVFCSTYKVDKNSALGKQGCHICHAGKKVNKDLTPYGKDLLAAVKASGGKKLTPEILKKIEKLDSTKTGSTNIQKIKAGKNPGTD